MLHQNEALQEREDRLIQPAYKARDTCMFLFLMWSYSGTWFLDWRFARFCTCYCQ